MMVDNSAFSLKLLDNPLGLAYSSFPELSMLIISSGKDPMTFHVFVFFLVCFLLLSPLVALSPVLAPSRPFSLESTRSAPRGPPSPQATYPTRLPGLSPYLPPLTGGRTIASADSALA